MTTEATKQLKAEAFGAIRQELGELGFQKRAGQIYTLKLNEDVLGWLGLQDHMHGGVLDILPFIGVRHQPIHRMLSELMGEKFHQYSPPTIVRQLGYFGSEHRIVFWYYQHGQDNAATAAAMASSVRDTGLPVVQAHTTLDY